MSTSRSSRCYTAYYVIMALEFALLLGLATLYLARLLRDGRRAKAAHEREAQLANGAANGAPAARVSSRGLKGAPSSGDLPIAAHWSVRKLLVVEAIALGGGTLATMLGLGGGAAGRSGAAVLALVGGGMCPCRWGMPGGRMQGGAHPARPRLPRAFPSPAAGLVAGPLLLALDVTPLVASATSSTIVLATVGGAGWARAGGRTLTAPAGCLAGWAHSRSAHAGCPAAAPHRPPRPPCLLLSASPRPAPCLPRPAQVGSATISYAVAGRLNLDYSLIYGACCVVGAMLGVTVVNYVVRLAGGLGAGWAGSGDACASPPSAVAAAQAAALSSMQRPGACGNAAPPRGPPLPAGAPHGRHLAGVRAHGAGGGGGRHHLRRRQRAKCGGPAEGGHRHRLCVVLRDVTHQLSWLAAVKRNAKRTVQM